MGKLSTDAQGASQVSTSASGKRAYPMPDASHAANAKARASQQEAARNLSPAVSTGRRQGRSRPLQTHGQRGQPAAADA